MAVLDRCKEVGAPAEPMHLDVIASVEAARLKGCMGRHSSSPLSNFASSSSSSSDVGDVIVVGGRYGLGGKEFNPAMVKAVFDNLLSPHPRRRFSVGIEDDVSHLSLPIGPPLATCPPGSKQCLFWGMGAVCR